MEPNPPRRRRRKWVLVVVAAAALSILFVVGSNEPRYEGKRLSEWLQSLDSTLPTYQPSEAERARNAVKAIGPRAVPHLISMMRCTDSNLRKRMISWCGRHNVRFKFLVPA